MKKVCTWCRNEIEEKEAKEGTSNTQAVCESCQQAVRNQVGLFEAVSLSK